MAKGWVVSEDGYFGTESAARDTLAAIQTYRNSAEAWERAVAEIRQDLQRQEQDLQSRLDELSESFNAERNAYKAEIRRGKMNQILYFVLAGVGGYFVGR